MKLRVIDFAGIGVLIALLAMVRFFEQDLFYDPLLPFFKTEDSVLPEYDSLKLFGGLAFRYFLNTAISLGIIWIAFKDKSILKLCAVLYGVFFVVLAIAMFVILNMKEPNLLALFYIRRFLIQPFLLLLFVPAFYYQKRIR